MEVGSNTALGRSYFLIIKKNIKHSSDFCIKYISNGSRINIYVLSPLEISQQKSSSGKNVSKNEASKFVTIGFAPTSQSTSFRHQPNL